MVFYSPKCFIPAQLRLQMAKVVRKSGTVIGACGTLMVPGTHVNRPARRAKERKS